MDYFTLAKTLIENKAKEILKEDDGAELVDCEICKKEHDIELSIVLGAECDRYACCDDCAFRLEQRLEREEERAAEDLYCKNYEYDHR